MAGEGAERRGGDALSEQREPLGEEALAEMAEEIGYREKRFAASPAESFTREADLQWMTAHASRLLSEVGRQRESIRALEGALKAYDTAIDSVRSWYPEEVFPPGFDSPDAKAAGMARKTCDNIKEKVRSLSGEVSGQKEE